MAIPHCPRLQHPTRSEAGFGLIEVIIAASIAIVIALGLSSMLQNANKAVHGIDKGQLFQELYSTVQQVVNTSSLCDSSFAATAQTLPAATGPATLTLGSLTLDANPPNNQFQNGALKITQFQFQNVTPLTAPNTYAADLYVQVDMQGKDLEKRVGSPTRDMTFKMVFTTSGAVPATIVNCGPATGGSYVKVINLSPGGANDLEVTCTNPSDHVTGGGVRSQGNNTDVWSWPVTQLSGVPSGITVDAQPAVAWHCHSPGTHVEACFVVCLP